MEVCGNKLGAGIWMRLMHGAICPVCAQVYVQRYMDAANARSVTDNTEERASAT